MILVSKSLEILVGQSSHEHIFCAVGCNELMTKLSGYHCGLGSTPMTPHFWGYFAENYHFRRSRAINIGYIVKKWRSSFLLVINSPKQFCQIKKGEIL